MKGMYRSRSVKRKHVRTPRVTRLHFKKKLTNFPTCAECGTLLHGVPRKQKGGSSSRPSRKYGGYLCHACLRKKLVESVRS